MTKLEQLISGYLNGEGVLDPSATITFLLEAELLADPFEPGTVEYGQHLVQVWRPSWLRGIDWDRQVVAAKVNRLDPDGTTLYVETLDDEAARSVRFERELLGRPIVLPGAGWRCEALEAGTP